MSAIAPDTRVVTKSEHVTTEVDGELVVLNNEAGTYQGLHGIGPDIWAMLREPTTVREIVDTVATEYDVDRERCEQDVREFLETLVDEQLVEVDAESA